MHLLVRACVDLFLILQACRRVRRAAGSHSIKEAPGSSRAFLSLGATWFSVGCSARPSLPLPQARAPPELQRSQHCWQSPPHTHPASIRPRYSTHRQRALITKQNYGPCLRTTCQGAEWSSLSPLSLSVSIPLCLRPSLHGIHLRGLCMRERKAACNIQ